MTKKPTARKKAPKAKPAAKRRVSASRPPRPGRGNVVTVSGGGVGIGGDVRGRTITIQQHSKDSHDRMTHITSPAEFMIELPKVREQIAALRQQPGVSPAEARRLAAVEGDLDDAAEETRRPAPLADRINTTLIQAKATMEALAGSVATAAALGATLAVLGQVALKLFGG